MQILIVLSVTWPGFAAHQGSTHVALWLFGIVLMFLPLAAVVQFCVRIWPLEGGSYQWVKYTAGPFPGFMTAWNFFANCILASSNVGILTLTGMTYLIGPGAAWMTESNAMIAAVGAAVFALILLANIPGFSIGRWMAYVGAAMTLFVAGLLAVLVFVHPHATALRPHVAPQPPFSLALPALTLTTLNLFSKVVFYSLVGLEQVAVFAGEIRNAPRTLLRSSWIAGPVIAVLYILMTGSLLTYTPAHNIDVTGPIAQLLTTAFPAASSDSDGVGWGDLLGRGVIVAMILTTISSVSILVAEASRLPMVAAWDHLLPEWFTRLHPRYKTPTRSLVVIVLLNLVFSLLACVGAAKEEAFQLLAGTSSLCYGISYLLMFCVPLLAGTRFSRCPGLRVPMTIRLASVSGIALTLLAIVMNLVPITQVPHPWVYALKVGLTVAGLNAAGAALYWRGSRASGTDGGGRLSGDGN